MTQRATVITVVGMLHWFRARARSIAAAVLVPLIALGSWSSAAHPSDCHDAECILSVLPHDPSAHGMQSATADETHPLHCVLCHWTRSLRPSADAVQHLPPPPEGDLRVQTVSFSVALMFPAAQPSLRAPPISPALA